MSQRTQEPGAPSLPTPEESTCLHSGSALLFSLLQTELTGGVYSAMQLFQKFPSVGLRCGSGQAPYECEERNWTICGFSLQGVEPQMGGSGELWPHPFSISLVEKMGLKSRD